MKGLDIHYYRKTAGALTVVGLLVGGIWAVDIRYAKASDVQQQIVGLTDLVLEMKLSDLRRQLFDILVAERRRELTDIELSRKQELEQEMAVLKSKLRND